MIETKSEELLLLEDCFIEVFDKYKISEENEYPNSIEEYISDRNSMNWGSYQSDSGLTLFIRNVSSDIKKSIITDLIDVKKQAEKITYNEIFVSSDLGTYLLITTSNIIKPLS